MTKGAIPDALSALHDALERAIQARAIDLESALHAELQSCYHSIGAFETSLNHCARRVAALQRQIGESAASTQDITQALRRVPDLRTRWANDPFAQA
jgi:ABC-type transporter Mla subunit MlaD